MAQWFPNDEIIVSGDSTYGGRSILSHLPPNVHLISHVHPNGALYSRHSQESKMQRTGPQKGDQLPGMKQWADDPYRPWTKLEFNQFGLHATLEVKTIQALYYKAGKDRLLTIVLTRTWKGNAPIRCSIVPSLIGRRGKSSRPTLVAGPLNAPLKIASSSWAWRTLPIVFPRPCATAPMALFIYVWWSFGFTSRDISCYVFPSDLGTEEGRAIVCRHVDDPEAVSYRRNCHNRSKTVWPENLDRPPPSFSANR